MSRPKLRGILIRATALVMSLVVSFVLFEGALRVLQLAPSSGVRTVDLDEFERVPGLFSPGQSLVDTQNPNLPFEVEIDSLGYRSHGVANAASRASSRLLMVGDSFTYGDFVDGKDSLPAQLESRLRRSCPDLSVVNAGVGGTTIISHRKLVDRGSERGFAAVVLTFSENDVADLASPLWFALESNRILKSRPPLSFLYPILQRTATWNFALKVRANLASFRRPPIDDAATEKVTPKENPATAPNALRAEYEKHLRSLRDELAAKAIPFTFVIYPSHLSVREEAVSNQLAWIEGAARSLGIRTISLRAPLKAAGLPMDEAYLLPHDGHPSSVGYSIAADEILAHALWPETPEWACVPRPGSDVTLRDRALRSVASLPAH